MQRVRRKKPAIPMTDWAGPRLPETTTNRWLADLAIEETRGVRSAKPADAAERAYRLALLGLTNKELAVAFGVSPREICRWLEAPDFRAAVFAGREQADGEVVRALYKKAVGYEYDEDFATVRKGQVIRTTLTKHVPPDTTACIYWLNNRTKRQDRPWTNSQKMEVTGAGGGPILLAPGEHDAVQGFSNEELEMIASAGVKLQLQEAPPSSDD
jgi:hypothetical protein